MNFIRKPTNIVRISPVIAPCISEFEKKFLANVGRGAKIIFINSITACFIPCILFMINFSCYFYND